MKSENNSELNRKMQIKKNNLKKQKKMEDAGKKS